MKTIRTAVVATLAAAGLVAAPFGHADPVDAYTGRGAPALVKAGGSSAYTITLTNDIGSPDSATRATVGVPSGFAVDALSLSAMSSATGSCVVATWTPALSLDGSQITLASPDDTTGALCPGASLTIKFDATAPLTDGNATWTTQLLRATTTFTAIGSDPSVVVDGTPPPVPTIDSSPAPVSGSASATFAFSESELGAELECRLDDASFSPCTSPAPYSGLADGAHSFQVRARDTVGNTSDAAAFSWAVDTSAPVATIASGPLPVTSQTSASFVFSSNESGSTFECKLDSGSYTACTSPAGYSSLANGAHTFYVRATDAASNTGAEATFGWSVDTLAPTATLTSTPAALTNDSTPSFAFTASEGGSTFECKLDSGSFTACSSSVNYTAQPDGGHTFAVRATDATGNTGPATTYDWTIDTTAPVATVSGPASLTNLPTATLSFSSNEAGSTFECKLDSASFDSCTSPKAYSGLADGSHTFAVRATDAAGNTGSAATYDWTVDTASPVATIGSGPPSATDQTTATFGVSSSEPGSTFDCKLDSGSFAPCTSPKTYSALAEGAHTFDVRAIDAAGNVGSETTYDWTVDTTNPVVTITSAPPSATNQTNAAFGFSSEVGSSFQCRLDAAAFASCTSPASYSGLVDGVHTFRVQATDAAGNVGPTTTYTWTIDRVAPTVTLLAKPDALTSDPTPSFAFSASEGGTTFACKLDATAFAACTSGVTYSSQADGAHTFRVKATDAAGNTGPEVVYTWTIDTTPPSAPVLQSTPPHASSSTNAAFTFSNPEAGVRFDCRLNGASFAPCSPGPNEQDYSSLADGAYTFRVRARDAAGNTSPATAYDWTVDTVAPTVTLTSTPLALTNDPTPSFAFSAREPGSTFQCKLDAAAFVACTSGLTYGPQPDGSHTFHVKATDAAGNTGPEKTYTWTIDTHGPTVTLTSTPNSPTNDTTPTFTFSANESGSTFECRLDSGSFSACTSPKSYSSPLPDGGHTFRVRATDPAGNAGLVTRFDWTIDTAAPTVAITSEPPAVTDDQTPSFVFSASEGGATFSCKLDTAAFAACTSPKTYAAQGDGQHTFHVKATDAAGNIGPETAYTWTIDTKNPLVTISGPAPATNQTSATFSFASNKDGSTFGCKLDSETSFTACTSPKTYSGLANGSHSLHVQATDPAGNKGEAAYVWTIDTVAPPRPSIGAGPPAATNQRSASFVFSDSEAVAGFSCQLDAGAFGACSSPKGYAPLADGPHSFVVRAQDAAGNFSSAASYTWTVDTVAPDTAIPSGPPVTSSGGSATFTFASNEAGATFACGLDGGAFSPCSSPQTYSGLGDGSHSLTARAVDAAGNVDQTPASYSWTVVTPKVIDTTPPREVGRLAKAVGYRLFRLSWALPGDPDFDHVSVFVATSKRGPLQSTVYTGKGTTFTNKRFRNGSYYRYAVISYDHAGNNSSEADVVVLPSALLRSPRDGAAVRKPPLLAWTPVRGATYYNVQIVYAGRKVLSTWPKRAHLQLHRSWTYAGAHRLKKGVYRWYAWPGFGPRSAARYGQLLGQASFVVR